MPTTISPISNQTVQPTKTLNLGEVKFQGRTYMAILHYCGEDGKELPITSEMQTQEVKEKYCSFLQEMLREAGEKEEFTGYLLDRVSTDGFIGAKRKENALPSLSHQQLKTEGIWRNFLFSLVNPNLAPYVTSRIKFINMDHLTPEKRKGLWKNIDQKIEIAHRNGSTKIELDQEEMDLLSLTPGSFPHLVEGNFNVKEWANLKTMISGS